MQLDMAGSDMDDTSESAEEVAEGSRLAGLGVEEFIQAVTGSMNLARDIGRHELGEIAQKCHQGWELDKNSMKPWRERMQKGIDLATLVKSEKNYPFEKAANVKYPLITSAALQFNARAYPAIVPADRVVSVKTFGSDRDGSKAARGERVSTFMSWQLLVEVEEWESTTDKMLTVLPIVGTIVRKVWYDPARGRLRCRMVDPGKFIVNSKVTTLDDAPRCTEELPLYPSEIEQRIKSGAFIKFDYEAYCDPNDDQSPQDFIEQHCLIDLNEDGATEPYIVTMHCASKTIVRVVTDFDAQDVTFDYTEVIDMVDQPIMDPIGQPVTDILGFPQMEAVPVPRQEVSGIAYIRRGSYFVPYHFLPSMDGGFYGVGLGLLLGDISETINTTINMLLDAGHMASLGGGFIGSDFRIKGGPQRHSPGEWKLTGSTGADIKNAIVPLTFPGPDAVLFQMLGMLIDAGREIASVKDVMTGDSGGRQMTATTTIALIEQGMMVFTAAYKRIFLSLKQEFMLMARINADTVDAEKYNAFLDEEQQYDPKEDFAATDMGITPVADPRSVTKMQEAAKAQLLLQLSDAGIVDKAVAAERVMMAADIPNREELAMKPDPMVEPMAKMALEAAMADLVQKRADLQLTMAKINETKASAMGKMADAEAKILGVQMDAMMTELEAQSERLNQAIGFGLASMAGQSGNASPQGGMGGQPGPAQGGPMPGMAGLGAGLGPQAGPLPYVA